MELGEHAAIPANALAERVFNVNPFGVIDDGRLGSYVLEGMAWMSRSTPDVFVTPANGGYRVARRYELMRHIRRDLACFSATQLAAPCTAARHVQIPLPMDSPEHMPYRQMPRRCVAPKPAHALGPHFHRRGTA